MSESFGAEFFAEIGSLIVEALQEGGFFSASSSLMVAITNNTSKPWKLAYCDSPYSRFVHRPDQDVPVGGSTFAAVKPPEGFMNLNFHMECDFYYNKTDKDEAFFRCHITKNDLSANTWEDTKPWNDCKFSTWEVINRGGGSLIWAKLIVTDP